MTNVLQLTLFGSPAVHYHGQPVTGFRSSKAQALLYYLAVTGRPHTRPTLAGLFWGDQPEAAARTSLSKCLSNLRDLVGDTVVVDRQTVAFNRQQPYHLDTEGFLAGIGQPPTPETIHTWQAALALYRGDFLEGFYVREAPDFEQWVLVQRAHYREAVLQGLYTLANWHEQGGDLAAAISHTRRLLTLEPWREEAHRQLMTRLARNGQRAAALAQFETCRQVLAEELAVEPDAETLALVEAIRTGVFDTVTRWQGDKVNAPQDHPATHSPPHPVPPPLPIPPTPLIGRDHELAELGELIGNPMCRLITIMGAGGMGKTRLALAAATEQSANFQHGALFVPLAGVSSAQFLAQAILSALNVPLQGSQAPQQQLCATLARQNCLLVLDNYEQLLPDVDLLLAILQSAPSVTLLVTSRERLALQAEYLHELTGLAYPALQLSAQKTEPAHVLTSYAALQLFLQRVHQIHPRFVLNDADVTAIVQICRRLDGIPLALELAAARARLLPIAHIAARLHESLHLLTAGSRAAPPRQQTLRATIDWSYNLLTEAERVLLRRLAVFAGGFPLTAVEQVCGPFATSLLDLMTNLVDKSLVVISHVGEETHYRLLETIREYAHEKLLSAGEDVRLRSNHLDFFTQLAETAYAQRLSSQQEHWLTQLERVHDNLRLALGWAIQQGLRAEALRLTGALSEFWDVRGYWREGRQSLAEALALPYTVSSNQEASSDQDLAASALGWEARALWKAGHAHWRNRDFVSAQANLQTSLSLYRQVNDPTGQSEVLSILGHVAFEQGKNEEAHSFFSECLALRLNAGNKPLIGYALHALGLVAISQRDFVTAQTVLSESLNLFREVGNKLGASIPLISLGDVAYLQANYAEAQLLYEQSLALRREVGDKRGVASTLASLANVRSKLDDQTMAQTLYHESLALYGELDNPHGMVRAIAGLARIHQLQGRLPLATTLLSLAESQLLALNIVFDTLEQADQEQALAQLRSQLDEQTFNAAWEKGRKLSLEQAIMLARQPATSIIS
ncbi:MAG: hypothetical protein DYG89_32630 [Caldilinea sp. CFX5]|nr:hypothetical protein [Caldilinea sp. CFX5]